MADYAHKLTNEEIKQLEKEIHDIYERANEEMKPKIKAYISRYQRRDKLLRKKLKNGEITKAYYIEWHKRRVFDGNRWFTMVDQLARDLANTSNIARSIIDGHIPEVYALNHNWATWYTEKQAEISTSYALYDRQTVEKLIREKPDLIPAISPKTERLIAEGTLIRWNKEKINGEILQGILQGEDINTIADRLQNVTTMNRNASIRNARTMMTSAQNAGRIDAFKRAESMGIELKKVWLATLDGRTRHSHRQLDGEEQDVNDRFSNGCLYPADPRGAAKEVYNCRCTLINKVVGIEYDVKTMERNSKLGSMSYNEWQNELRK